MDNSDVIPALVQIMIENDAINAACDGEIHAANWDTLADDWLENTLRTCIIVHDINQNDSPYIGSASSGEYDFETLFQIDVLSRAGDCRTLAKLVSGLVRGRHLKTYFGVSYNFTVSEPTMTPMGKDASITAFHYMLRMKASGVYVCQ